MKATASLRVAMLPSVVEYLNDELDRVSDTSDESCTVQLYAGIFGQEGSAMLYLLLLLGSLCMLTSESLVLE